MRKRTERIGEIRPSASAKNGLSGEDSSTAPTGEVDSLPALDLSAAEGAAGDLGASQRVIVYARYLIQHQRADQKKGPKKSK